MSGDYIFIASGDSCSTCTALHGTYVENAGYRPHPSCTCNTVRRKDGANCELVAEEQEIYEDRYRPGHFRVRIGVTITCPDGDEPDISGVFDGDFDNSRHNADLVEGLARDLCESACDSGDDEFLCC